jgi:hypothetical protein
MRLILIAVIVVMLGGCAVGRQIACMDVPVDECWQTKVIPGMVMLSK